LDDAGDRLGIATGLEAMAAVSAPVAATRAARLLGAAAALRRAIGTPLAPMERPAHAMTVRAISGRLGAPAFAEAWRAGAALPLTEAVAEARRGAQR
jgi:hypothetical protein